MMLDRCKRLIVLPVLMCISLLNAQDVLDIRENRIVKAGETFTIKEGTLVKLGPGVTLDVRGNLIIKGTKSKPVRFTSADPNNPAMGITVSGIQEEGNVQIHGVEFDGLVQPMRFDPFWYRKNVSIQEIIITNGKSYEPLVYMASPFIDLRDGKKISVKMYAIEAVNNASGILIESFGSNGISHEMDKLYFGDNQIPGGDASFGMLHLDFAEATGGTIPPVGRLAFERNDANGTPLGLSVSGSSSKTLSIAGIYGEDPLNVVFDQKKDARVPMVNVGKTGTVADFGASNSITYLKHSYGDVSVKTTGDLTVKELRDSEGNLVELTRSMTGDTQHYSYIQGKPTEAILSNGRKLRLPAISGSDLPNVEITKIDTAEYNKYKRQSEINGGGLEQSDVLTVGVNIPTFAKKGEVVRKLRIWEFGIWGGGGLYGNGDIQAKFFGLPSTIDVSAGLYGQYNFNSRFSMKISGYNTTISIHDLYSIGLFSGTKPLMAYNENYQEFTSSANSYRVHFTTPMWIGEIEGMWHLRSYQIKDGKKSKLIPSLGLSLGMLYYTPYRYAYTNQKKKETYSDYVARMKSEHRYNLRELGSEGQNFLPNSKPYSTIAFNIGTSFTLTYLFKRVAFKGEMRVAYTSTDYLDDFGPGFWYGGDVDALIANQKLQNEPKGADLRKIIGYDARIATNAPRSVDGLNDWYYQLHLGMSYILIK